MNRFSTQNENGSGENGFLKRVVGAEFGNHSYQDPFTGTGRYIPGNAPVAPISIGLLNSVNLMLLLSFLR
jgi:hypothetical protein